MYPAAGDGGIRNLPAAAWWVLGLQGLKLYLCWQLPLFGDEAFYWLEAGQLAPAYDDVPLLVPGLIAAATGAFGDAPLVLRLPGLLLSWMTLLVLYRAALALADAATAWRCLLLASLPPLLAMNGVMMLPDVGLNLAIVACLWGAQRTLQGHADGRWWLAAGVLLGLLAHYRFAVPLAAAGLAVLLWPSLRTLLRWARLWPALLALLAGLAPLLWHTLAAEGQGLAFQFVDRHPFRFQPALLADPLVQALVVGPPLYVLLLWAGWRARNAGSGVSPWAGWGLVLLLLYWLAGPWVDSERSRLHWPAPGYLALALPLAVYWPSLSVGLRRLAVICGIAWCATGGAYLIAVARFPDALAGSRLYPDNFLGAQRLAVATREQWSTLDPRAPLVVDHFLLAAQLEHHFAREGQSRPVFVLEHPQNAKHGRQAVLSRLNRDATVLPSEHPEGLLLVEPAALPLRQRAAWLWSLCQKFPQASWLGERWFDFGRKRYAVYRFPSGDIGERRCAPPVVGYIDLLDGSPLSAGQRVSGWAVAGATGVNALRLTLDGKPLALDWPRALPSLAQQLGEVGDPAMPAVGWEAVLPAQLGEGRGWLLLEALTPERDWHPVASTPVERDAE